MTEHDETPHLEVHAGLATAASTVSGGPDGPPEQPEPGEQDAEG